MSVTIARSSVPMLFVCVVGLFLSPPAGANDALEDLLRIASHGDPADLVAPLQRLYVNAAAPGISEQILKIQRALEARYQNGQSSLDLKKRVGEALARTLFSPRVKPPATSPKRPLEEKQTPITRAIDHAVVLSVWILADHPETFVDHLEDATVPEGTKLQILWSLTNYWNLREARIRDTAAVQKLIVVYQSALMGGNTERVRAAAIESIAVAGGGYYYRDSESDYVPHGQWWVMDKLIRMVGRDDPPAVVEAVKPLLQTLCFPTRTIWKEWLSDPQCDSKLGEYFRTTENAAMRGLLLRAWEEGVTNGSLKTISDDTIAIFKSVLLDVNASRSRKPRPPTDETLHHAYWLGRNFPSAFGGNASLTESLQASFNRGADERLRGRVFNPPSIGSCSDLVSQTQ